MEKEYMRIKTDGDLQDVLEITDIIDLIKSTFTGKRPIWSLTFVNRNTCVVTIAEKTNTIQNDNSID